MDPWQPRINVFDETLVKANITKFLKDNQTQALAWANGGQALSDIKKFFASPQLVTVFPALTFLQTNHRSTYEDLLETKLELVLELAVINGKQDVLSEISPKYSMALASMIVNMPPNNLLDLSLLEAPAFSTDVEVTFDVQGKYKTQFIQVLQQRYSWKITAQAYA